MKFFPTKEDAISYVEANEKQYMNVNGNLVECEVEYSLLQPVLHRLPYLGLHSGFRRTDLRCPVLG